MTPNAVVIRSSVWLCAAMIMQGLLASGDYTHRVRYDGDEWKEDGEDRRYASHAACAAAGLLEELKARMKRDLDESA